ncbi:hypothetical protein ACFSJU_03410 [Paradesertivirga mongoliensis]|uniref:HTH cro/C1-type domain-containing protein n=1 Tax=Paradesertivirga mongoliensis TaxID=2100740 RepID=A0ABW4ZHI4_9SPHI|nr:hypothetical protein [Pedobacter mongoliensis]
MELKKIVDTALKDQNRSLSWLAGEMNKTFDGLKLSLVKGSLKYTDIKKMAEILKLPAGYFFGEDRFSGNIVEEEKGDYTAQKGELNACKELAATLKSQLADKEKIIELLSQSR